MLLADSFIFVVGLLFLIGIVGFFVMTVVLMVRFFGFILRLITGSSRHPATVPRFEPRHDVCPHQRCGHVNRQGALFCARCGRSLHQHSDVDAYG